MAHDEYDRTEGIHVPSVAFSEPQKPSNIIAHDETHEVTAVDQTSDLEDFFVLLSTLFFILWRWVAPLAPLVDLEELLRDVLMERT